METAPHSASKTQKGVATLVLIQKQRATPLWKDGLLQYFRRIAIGAGCWTRYEPHAASRREYC